MYPSTPMQYNKYKTILEQVSHPQEAIVNARNETTKSTTTLDYYNKNAKKFITGTISVDFGIVQNRFLDKLHPGAEILDYGCGSGILAIAAAKLGAGDVHGVDIDLQAVSAAKSNAERNEVSAHFDDSAKEIKGQFDIVVANILSNPLKALAPAICSHVRPGGLLALSGILAEQADDLIAYYAPYVPLSIADTRDGWVCLSGTKTS